MAFIEWKNAYSVGIEKIDSQHKELVGHLNDLYEALKVGKGKDALDTVLNGLVDYTKAHFSTEESLMKFYKYPGYDEHKHKHQKMTERVLQLKEKFDSGELSNPLQITTFLRDWLNKHIMETDKGYGPFLNAKGVK